MQRFAARILTRILSCFSASARHDILMKLFRHSASNSLDMAAATEDGALFEKYLHDFFGELQIIVKKAAELRARNRDDEKAGVILKALLEMDNLVYKGISLKALEYGKGLHPKHRLTRYHDFFCDNVGREESIIDIGCGNGFLTGDVARRTSGRVVGIDMNKNNIEFARNRYQADNIEFILGDVHTHIEESHFDVVIMSNVLEHLSDRPQFLSKALKKLEPSKFLIRVPMYDREWMVPMKDELGVEYMLDTGHEIEYTLDCLFKELSEAGLKPERWEIKWGEIWCVAIPDVNETQRTKA